MFKSSIASLTLCLHNALVKGGPWVWPKPATSEKYLGHEERPINVGPRILSASKYIYPNYVYLATSEIKSGARPITPIGMDFGQDSIYHWACIKPEGHSCVLGTFRSILAQTLYPKVPGWKIWVFLFLHCIVTLVNGCPFGEGSRWYLSYILHIYFPFSRESGLSLPLAGFVCGLPEIWKLVLVVIQVDIPLK